MKPQNVRYFVREQSAPDATPGVLVDVSVQGVPILLNGLEVRKASRNWAQGEWEFGYQWLCMQQERLLMDASRRVISEIRQVRGPLPGQDPTETYDPEETPQYNGTQLYDVLFNNQSGLEGVNEKLQVLVDEAIAAGNEEQLELLRGILLVLGGAV